VSQQYLTVLEVNCQKLIEGRAIIEVTYHINALIYSIEFALGGNSIYLDYS
jgi:hypothetical protein